MEIEKTFTAFCASRRVGAGRLREVLVAAKAIFDDDPGAPLLVFEDTTGQQVEFDYAGSVEQVLRREIPSQRPIGPGRPKLGVVSREISLLPRHWEYLEAQTSGVSGAIRRLVEDALKREPGKERARRMREGIARVMTALAGDAPGYEEALRALYAREYDVFVERTAEFARDVRRYLVESARAAEALERGHGK